MRINAVLSNVAELREVLRVARYEAVKRTVLVLMRSTVSISPSKTCCCRM